MTVSGRCESVGRHAFAIIRTREFVDFIPSGTSGPASDKNFFDVR
jgi:hypothetical protein